MAIRIADLLPTKAKVEVSPDKFVEIRSLTLAEMVQLFLVSQDLFLSLYAKFQEGSTDTDKLAPFLLGAPEFVANVLAYAMDAEGQQEDIKRMPPTVQLIALNECWKMSVPDPKKARELLSVVMAQLRQLSQKGKQQAAAAVVQTLEQSSEKA